MLPTIVIPNANRMNKSYIIVAISFSSMCSDRSGSREQAPHNRIKLFKLPDNNWPIQIELICRLMLIAAYMMMRVTLLVYRPTEMVGCATPNPKKNFPRRTIVSVQIQ